MSKYRWITEEIATVKNRTFFVFDPDSASKLADFQRERGCLPPDYVAFASEWGAAKLFRDPVNSWHRMKVFVPPVPFAKEGDGELLQIGYSANEGCACYLFVDRHAQDKGAVFQGAIHPIRRLSRSFEEWFLTTFRRTKKNYPKKSWTEMTGDVMPFDRREEEIVSAIKLFNFRKVGISADGGVLIEVQNRSSMKLQFLTIGVKFGRLTGFCAIPVESVEPGETQVIERSFYKGAADPKTIELVQLELPTPEDRRYFWEFSGRGVNLARQT
jgi:hypothetical protein